MNNVIAEAGSNHNGDKDTAVNLVDIANLAGATSIKFQFIFPDGLYLPDINIDGKLVPSEVYEVRQKEQLTTEAWSEVWQYAQKVGIDISASVFCMEGVKLLYKLGANYVKIASTDLTNLSLIKLACQNFKKVIISTGMATLDEISRTVRMVRTNFLV